MQAFIKRHPLFTYYTMAFAISWGGILLAVGGPGGIPDTPVILLMLGNDARRNFANYFGDPASNRIAEFINRPNWREEFQDDGQPVRYVLNAFDEPMQQAGYPSARQNLHRICAEGTSVLQYMLAFYSKNPAGTTLWRECMKSLARLDTQGSLDLN